MMITRRVAPSTPWAIVGARAMSRVGLVPVKIPTGAAVKVEAVAPPLGDILEYPVNKRLWRAKPRTGKEHDFGDCDVVTVTGPKGEVSRKLHSVVRARVEGDNVVVEPRCGGNSRCGRTMWGTSRAHIANMVHGVTRGYKRDLELVGVGFRAAMQGDGIMFKIGFSHDVTYRVPDRMQHLAQLSVPNQTTISVTGIDKHAVNEVAAQIRDLRRPEPYKGKGIRYAGEVIKLKQGKKK